MQLLLTKKSDNAKAKWNKLGKLTASANQLKQVTEEHKEKKR